MSFHLQAVKFYELQYFLTVLPYVGMDIVSTLVKLQEQNSRDFIKPTDNKVEQATYGFRILNYVGVIVLVMLLTFV